MWLNGNRLCYMEERSLCAPVAPPVLEAQLREAPANHMLSQLGLPASNRDTLTLIRSAGEVLSLVLRHDSKHRNPLHQNGGAASTTPSFASPFQISLRFPAPPIAAPSSGFPLQHHLPGCCLFSSLAPPLLSILLFISVRVRAGIQAGVTHTVHIVSHSDVSLCWDQTCLDLSSVIL